MKRLVPMFTVLSVLMTLFSASVIVAQTVYPEQAREQSQDPNQGYQTTTLVEITNTGRNLHYHTTRFEEIFFNIVFTDGNQIRFYAYDPSPGSTIPFTGAMQSLFARHTGKTVDVTMNCWPEISLRDLRTQPRTTIHVRNTHPVTMTVAISGYVFSIWPGGGFSVDQHSGQLRVSYPENQDCLTVEWDFWNKVYMPLVKRDS